MMDVGVSGAIDRVQFSISLPRNLFEFTVKPADIYEIEVRDWTALAARPRENGQPQPEIWRVHAETCQRALTRVRYGETPAGFTVQTNALALREGGSYMVGVRSCHYLHDYGIATFRIRHGRAVESVWD
jgi:hypothetical protein